MALTRGFSVIAVFVLLLFQLLSASAQKEDEELPGPRPDFVDALWIALQDGPVMKIGLPDLSILLEIPDERSAETLAVDARQGLLWIYDKNQLQAFSFAGEIQQEAAVPIVEGEEDEEESGPHVALAVNSKSGTVWLAQKRMLFQFDSNAHLPNAFQFPDHLRALALDESTSRLWLATRSAIFGAEETGSVIQLFELGHSAQIRDLVVDQPSGELWVIHEDGVMRLDTGGGVSLEVPLRHLALAASDYQGGLWLATNRSILRLDPFGVVLFEVESPGKKSQKIQALAAHPLDGSLWVVTKNQLIQIGSQGEMLQSSGLPELEEDEPDPKAAALYVDAIPPEIAFAAPKEGIFTNDNTPLLQLSFSDVGIGVNPSSLQVKAGGDELPLDCTFAEEETDCTPSPLPEGEIHLSATVRDYNNNVSGAASLSFTVDTIPPEITLLSPPEGFLTNRPEQTFPGHINEPATLMINGEAAALQADLSFQQVAVLLEGLNLVVLQATDRAGNQTILVRRLTLDTIPPAPADLTRIEINPAEGGVRVRGLPGNVEAFSRVRIENSRTGQSVTVPASGEGAFEANVEAEPGDTLEIVVVDGADNASDPVEVLLRFGPAPPVLSAIGDQTIPLGRTLELQLAATDPNGDSFTFSASPLPLPANAQLNAGTGFFRFIPAAHQVGTFVITFAVSDGTFTDSETVNIQVLGPGAEGITSLTGRVLDTNDFVEGKETPIVGAVVSLLGTGRSTTNDGSGRFTLDDVPGGHQILDIATATAEPAPDGSPYAGFREAIELIDGVDNVVSRPFFLPRIARESLTLIDRNNPTVVRNPTLNVTLTVPAHTAKNPDGTDFTGFLSISEVPLSLAPAALPEELEPGLLLTIQPVGVTFATPVPLTVPNIDRLPPGSETDLWSLDPERGVFDIVGRSRVSADGTVIQTISGGVRAADWHAMLPLQTLTDGSGNNGEMLDPEKCTECGGRSSTSVASGNLRIEHELVGYRSLNETRQLSVVYNSTAADPRPVIGSSVTIAKTTALPELISPHLEVAGVDQPAETFTSTDGLSDNEDETIRQAVQFDAEDFSTGAYPYRLKLTSHYEASRISSIQSGDVLVVNQQASPIGAGWGLAGLEHLHFQPDGSVLSVDGDGSARLFRSASRIAFSDFSDLSRLILNGAAATIGNPVFTGGKNLLRLAVGVGEVGSAFLQDALPIKVLSEDVSFRSFFEFQIRNADGLTFTVATDPNRLGFGGGSLGYAGISPSLAVEFDTWGNSEFGENSSSHVGINLNGSIISRVSVPVSLPLSNGSVKRVWVDYDGASDMLEVRVSEGTERPNDPVASFRVDLPGLLRQDTAYFGFTAAAGADGGAKDVVSWVLEIIGAGNSFRSPPGDFSKLERNPDGTFTRTLKHGTRLHFNAEGLQTSLVDRNGNTTHFSYNEARQLASITDPVALLTSFSYLNDRLASVTDPAGRITHFDHDEGGNLTTITDPDGTRRVFQYDQRHRLVAEISKRGFETSYLYNSAGRNVGELRPDGSRTALTPSQVVGLPDSVSGSGTGTKPVRAVRASDVIATFTDGNGNITRFRTNRFGTATETVNALSHRVSLSTDESGNVTRIVSPREVITNLGYDLRGNLVEVQDAVGTPLARKTLFKYDPEFNLVNQIIDPTGNITAAEYDSHGNPLQIRNALGKVRTFRHDSQGLLLSYTDENSNASNFDYDANGNLSLLTDAEGNITRYERDIRGNVISITEGVGDPAARTSFFAYDTQGRLLSITDGTGAVTRFRYDAVGNPTEVEDPTGQILRRFYDEMNRLARIEDPARGATEFGYDGDGKLLRSVDALGAVTTFEYDAADRLVQSTDALGGTQRFTYDQQGNVVALQDARGQVTSFEYDSLNRLIQRANPLSQSRRFTYDSRDNVLTEIDPRGQVIENSYDPLSRLIRIKTPDDEVRLSYDAVGNLLAVEDNDSGLNFAYDRNNRLVTTRTLDVGAQPTVTLTAAYDATGNRTELADSAGGTTLFGYDAADRLIQLTTPAGALIDLSYDPAGRTRRIAFPNGVTSVFDYDPTGRLARLSHAIGPSLPFADFSYSYNAVGNVAAIAELDQTRSFTYDALQRLVSGETEAAPEFYEYDPLGNRVRSFLSSNHVHDIANRLLEDDDFTYIYDGDGNLETKISKATGEITRYSYDAQDQLVRIDFAEGTSASYRYDGLGRRIEKDVDGSITRYVYDGADIFLEFEGTNTLLARYSHGDRIDQPLSQERSGQTFFYHADHLGSIRLITDSSGSVVNHYDYDSYGRLQNVLESIPNPYTYTGRELDPESGLYYYRARYYNPTTGRFITQDPIAVFDDGNPYKYVSNNPLNYTDPPGLFRVPATQYIEGRREYYRMVRRAVKSVFSNSPTVNWLLDVSYPLDDESIAQDFGNSILPVVCTLALIDDIGQAFWKKVVSTFRGGRSKEITLKPGTILYRAFQRDVTEPLGSFFTRGSTARRIKSTGDAAIELRLGDTSQAQPNVLAIVEVLESTGARIGFIEGGGKNAIQIVIHPRDVLKLKEIGRIPLGK